MSYFAPCGSNQYINVKSTYSYPFYADVSGACKCASMSKCNYNKDCVNGKDCPTENISASRGIRLSSFQSSISKQPTLASSNMCGGGYCPTINPFTIFN